MKRELAFALETQSQFTGSLGNRRTSIARNQTPVLKRVSGNGRSSKKRKGSNGDKSELKCISVSTGKKVTVDDDDDNSSSDFELPICEYKKKLKMTDNLTSEAILNGVCDSATKGESDETMVEAVKNAETSNEVEADGSDVIGSEEETIVETPKRLSRSALAVESPVQEVSGSAILDANDNGATTNMDEDGISGKNTLWAQEEYLGTRSWKKLKYDKKPETVKELFATGLLEGYPVLYKGGKKLQGHSLSGIIKDDGILCFCRLCKGSRVINPCNFEIHACNSYRRASQYICLENGKSLLDIVKACQRSPLYALEETIKNIIGPLPEKELVIYRSGCFPATMSGNLNQLFEPNVESENFKTTPNDTSLRSKTLRNHPKHPTGGREIEGEREPFWNSSGTAKAHISRDTSCNGVRTERSSRSASVRNSSTSTSDPLFSIHKSQRKKSKKLLNSGSARKTNGSVPTRSLSRDKKAQNIIKKSIRASPVSWSSEPASSQKKIKWKITKKDQRLHGLVFEEGGLPEGSEVGYYSCGRKILDGYKRGAGIFCLCCNCEVSASQFEAHAGWASRKKPYNYIYTSNGVSLHEFAISLLKGSKSRTRDSDDLCTICADGGNLLLCDLCPRAFHIDCASLSSIPSGKWYCNYCQNMFIREKFVENNANAVAAGRVSGVDPIEQITKRCIRMVKIVNETEAVVCVLCRGTDFRKTGFGQRTVIVCDQCEKEYHVGCLREQRMADLMELPKGKWFCCTDCGSIYSALQQLVVVGEERIPDDLLDIMKEKKKQTDEVSDTATEFDVRWMLLSGQVKTSESRLLLSKAVAIFHDRFDPIVYSGCDYIPAMVYGRDIRGQDFAGMYCAILKVNSTVVSAGIIRVFGQEIAELPLVATNNVNQGKGYFQILFSCIEKLLVSLKVKNLLVPAADEAESIWTNKFGFEKVTPEQLTDYQNTYWQLLNFEGTAMLQKKVPLPESIEQTIDV